MAPKIDPAILKALSLDGANTTLTSHGGSGFSSTYKLSSRGGDGKEKTYFVKTGGKGSEVMFAGKYSILVHSLKYPQSRYQRFRCVRNWSLRNRGEETANTTLTPSSHPGEHLSLNTIHALVPTFCPQSFAYGALSSSSGSFLVTDFLNLSPPSSSKPGSGISLAHKLAKLHSTPAPIPDGYEKPMFGFPVSTCCGETVQENGFMESVC